MAKKKVLVKSKSSKKGSEVATFLRELADKVETGQVSLVQDGQEVLVKLPETVDFEMEYYEQPKKHGLKKKLEIEIKWTEGGKKHQGVTLE